MSRRGSPPPFPFPDLLVGLFGAALLTGCAARIAADGPESRRQRRIAGQLADGSSYDVVLVESRYRGQSVEWWGTDGSVPQYVVAEMGICLGGESIRLPEACFRDLAEVSELTMEMEAGKPRLTVRGGDAAGSYFAHYVIVTDGFCRHVEHGEMGGQISERARWDRTGKLIRRDVRNDFLK
jgi:hypothetical protein